MAVYVSLVLVVLAVLSLLLMLYFFLRALRSRRKFSAQAYNVGQQEARRSARINSIRALLFFLLAVVLLAGFAATPSLTELMSAPTATPLPPPTDAPTGEATLVPTATVPATPEPTGTVPLPTPSETPAATMTLTPAPLTATVSSGVGVWLRESPGTESAQLEWLLEGTVVFVLPGEQTAEDLLWQQVQTEEGITGWVASDFIIVNEP